MGVHQHAHFYYLEKHRRLWTLKLTDEQIEYVTDVMHSTIMDISNEIGFKPEYSDIIKCLDYTLKSL